jgi:hypothetical protein
MSDPKYPGLIVPEGWQPGGEYHPTQTPDTVVHGVDITPTSTQPAGIVGGDRVEAGGGLTPVAPIPASEADAQSTVGYGDIFSSILPATPVANAFRYLTQEAYPPDPNYNPIDDPQIKGTVYEQNYLMNFVGSESAKRSAAIIREINAENGRTMAFTRGGVTGFLAGMTAGLLDPTMLIPVSGWVKGGIAVGRGMRALEAGASVGAAAAIQEGVLQATEETRTAGQSAFAIGGSVLLGSVLGVALGHSLAKPEFDRLAGTVEDHMNAPTGVGAAAVAEARGSGEQVGSFGVQRALRLITPKARTQTSELTETRNTARDLIAGNALEENKAGIPSSEGGSVEARIGTSLGDVHDIAEMNRSLYSRYFFGKDVSLAPTRAGLSRLFGRGQGKLSFADFRQAISDAALAGDEHAIPEVAEAAKYRRSHLVDPYRDEAMNVVKGFKELVEAGSADQSYLTRIWNRVAVKAKFNELVSILTDHFNEVQVSNLERIADLERRTGADEWAFEFTQLSKDELKGLAEDTVNTILGQSPGRMFMPGDFVKVKRGPLAERALASLPTTKVLPFVERDIEKIDNFYARTMAADINLTRKFGSVDMVDRLQKITDEANAKKVGKSEKEQTRLANVAEADKRDITAMRDIIRGTYRLPDNPDGMLHRGVQAVKTLNFLSSLGMMTVSSISDVGKPVFIHGLTRSMKTVFTPFVRGLHSYHLARADAKLAGVGLDMIAGDRVLALNELANDYAAHTMAERGLSQAGRAFGVLTLMSPWNAVMKQFAGVMTITRALKAVEDMVKGTISAKERAYLAEGGIGENLADRIWKQYAGGASLPADRGGIRVFHGSPHDFKKFDTSKIGSGEGAQAYGHGLYFAENEAVGKSYRDRLGGQNGALYEVRLDAKPEEFLDWDTPISEQSPELRAAIKKALPPETIAKVEELTKRLEALNRDIDRGGPSADDAIREKAATIAELDKIDPSVANTPAMADALNKVGIKGLRYQDAGSRGAAGGTYNYVVFDHSIVNTVAKNGLSIAHGGEDGGIRWAGTGAWTDREAKSALHAFIYRDVNRIIVTPGVGDKPLRMHGDLGSIIGQFQSFALASVQHTLVSGLQQRDMAAFNGMMVMLALGALSYKLKSDAAGIPTADPSTLGGQVAWASEALDNSGVLGVLMNADHAIEKMTSDRIGLSALTGKPFRRYMNVNTMGAFLGPSLGKASDILDVVSAAFRGKITDSDTHKIRKLIPLQNLFWARGMFNSAEHGINDAFGIQAKN